jgi:hypothetical protein
MRLLAFFAFVVACFLLTSCDYFVSYTVTNETDKPVRTGWFYSPCSYETERVLRQGPLDRIIAPGTDLRVDGVVGSEPECIVVKSNDETIILLADYVDGGRYVVSGSEASSELQVFLAQQTTPAPGHTSTGIAVYVLMAIVGLGGVIALGITVRYFYGYYFSKSHAS